MMSDHSGKYSVGRSGSGSGGSSVSVPKANTARSAPGATPGAPSSGRVADPRPPAMTLATAVPCEGSTPLSSVAPGRNTSSIRVCAKAGWSSSIPVSTIPTVTPDPGRTSSPCCIARRAYAWSAPIRPRPHCLPKAAWARYAAASRSRRSSSSISGGWPGSGMPARRSEPAQPANTSAAHSVTRTKWRMSASPGPLHQGFPQTHRPRAAGAGYGRLVRHGGKGQEKGALSLRFRVPILRPHAAHELAGLRPDRRGADRGRRERRVPARERRPVPGRVGRLLAAAERAPRHARRRK